MNAQKQWSTLGSIEPAKLTDAMVELHWAVQFVASAGQTFAEPREDDSHRAMTWDADQRAFVSAYFGGSYPFRVGVRPEDLTLLLLDRAGEALGSLPLSGRTRDEGYEWLALGLATFTGGAQTRMDRPEYDMPTHAVADRGRFSSGFQRERQALTALYGIAGSLLESLTSSRDGASPVLCWPHHFDIATLITLATDDDGKPVKTVGAGMAPMGGGYDSWYWYVTPWPRPPADKLPALEGPGAWHTEGWTGAVLTGTDVVATDEAFREAVVRKFLHVSVEAAIAMLDLDQ